MFQRWTPFSDFAFDCKSEIRILNLNPDFPIERTQSGSDYKEIKAIKQYFLVIYVYCAVQRGWEYYKQNGLLKDEQIKHGQKSLFNVSLQRQFTA